MRHVAAALRRLARVVEREHYTFCQPDDGLLYVEVPDFDHLQNLLITRRWRHDAHLKTLEGYVPYFGGGIAFHLHNLVLRGVRPLWYPREDYEAALAQVLEDDLYADEFEAREFEENESFKNECEWRGPRGMTFQPEDVAFAWIPDNPRFQPSDEQLDRLREIMPDLEIRIGRP